MISHRDNLTDFEWDMHLSQIGGHPLQSALWGNAKHDVYGIMDERLALYSNEKLVALIRIELRGKKPFLACAWIPQGPVFFDEMDQSLHSYLMILLKKRQYSLCAIAPWKVVVSDVRHVRKTIWINLQKSREKIWEALDKQWRYGVGRSRRLGVETALATTKDEVSEFYRLCLTISREKKFRFAHSEDFLHYLIEHGNNDAVCGRLFLAKYDNVIVSGAFILQSGKNIHYFFGAVDRRYSSLRAGELVQWFVIEWACEQGLVCYDLEGIDPDRIPSVAAFKKKMGGDVVALSPVEITAIKKIGKPFLPIIKRKLIY